MNLIQALTDNSQTVVWQASYTPFGEAAISTDIVENNILLPGQYYDQESGLHYNYFRDYDPEIGRYVQSDPIGLLGGINTYGYAYQNPISNVDPLGLMVEGVYNKTTGTLIITNLDNGKVLTANAFSGTPGRYTPAPNGTYTLSDFPWGSSAKDHYFALLLNDGRLDDYADGHASNYDPSKTMSNIRLHSGYASHACVTVPGAEDSEQWLPIQEMILGTSKGAPIVIGGESFPNYGTIRVTGSGFGSVP